MAIVLEDVIVQALKQAGAEAVTDYEKVERLPTGSLTLDRLLGGGLARGRFQTLSGWPSYGKSTLAQLIAAETIRNGGLVCYVDTENAYEPTWAQAMGVDPSKFALIHVQYAEDTLDALTKIIASGTFDLICWDSIAATPWKYYVDASADDTPIGKHAQKWNQWHIRNSEPLGRSGTALLAINQIREKIGVMFGSPEYEPGGKSHQFAASIRMRLLKPDEFKVKMPGESKERVVGHTFNLKVQKNKTAPKGDQCSINVYADRQTGMYGIDPIADLMGVGGELGVFTDEEGVPIKQSSKRTWFYAGERIDSTEADVAAALRGWPEEKLAEAESAVRLAITEESSIKVFAEAEELGAPERSERNRQ